MKEIKLAPGKEVEGCLIDAICGSFVMRNCVKQLIIYNTIAEISIMFAGLEGHHIIVRVNEMGTELELIRDYGKCPLKIGA